MKKTVYAVCTDTIEIKSSTIVGSQRIGKPFPRSFSEEELENIYFASANLDEEVQMTFNTKEEAIAKAEEMPVFTRAYSYIITSIVADIVTVEEIEIDEDGEKEWTGLCLFRAAPYVDPRDQEADEE